MTKISKQTKLEAILAYHTGSASKAKVAKHYGIAKGSFSMLLAAYATHGPDVLFNPPEITGEFRIAVASWAIRENASLTAVAAKFGYVGMAQIVKWKEIYSKLGPNGLLSIQKGRKPKMTKKKQNQPNKLSEEENRLAQLERDIELLNQFDVITLPSKLAREVLTNDGLNVPVVIQTDPFDFLTNTPINYPTFSHTVNYAGNISFIKAGFLENINDVYMHIFGSNLDFTLPTNLEYMGQFDNDTLISKLNTGYGLLWDSDGVDNTTFKTYEKYNWQYKLSLYLASGIIPIADTNSNVGIWLNNNKCGLTLDILEELNNSIMAISKSQYEQLQSNVRIQQHRLREGYYTKELISSIEYELNKNF